MKKLIIIASFLLFSQARLSAQLFPQLGGQRAGISAAQFLKIGVGGRATAMGDAFTAVANDASSLYWNPAGLVQSEQNEVLFSHINWVADISHEFAGALYHLSSQDALGVAFTSLHMDDMPVTTETMPFGTGAYFSYGDMAFALTYSRKMTDKFSFGATLRYIEETMDKIKMNGLMMDLGTYYWTGLGTTRFSVVLSNFGGNITPEGDVTLFDGSKKSDWQSFSPPTMFRIGLAMEPYQSAEHRLTASVQLNHPNDNSENISTGVEYAWREMFFLRAGYKFNVDENHLNLGTGLKVPVSIADLTADYSYSKYQRLGSVHRFSIILGF